MRMRLGWIALAAALLCAVPAMAKDADRDHDRDRDRNQGPLMGLELGMTRELALDRVGMLGPEEKEALEKGTDRDVEHPGGNGQPNEEVWMLASNPRWRSVTVHFGGDGRLEWAIGQAGVRPLRFRDIGNVKRARRTGNVYVWSVPARGSQSAYQITARGQDSNLVQSVAIGRPAGPATAAPKQGRR